MKLIGRKTVFGNQLLQKKFSLDGHNDNKINKKNTTAGFRNSEAPSSYSNKNCMFHNLHKNINDTEIIKEESTYSVESNRSPNLTI